LSYKYFLGFRVLNNKWRILTVFTKYISVIPFIDCNSHCETYHWIRHSKYCFLNFEFPQQALLIQMILFGTQALPSPSLQFWTRRPSLK